MTHQLDIQTSLVNVHSKFISKIFLSDDYKSYNDLKYISKFVSRKKKNGQIDQNICLQYPNRYHQITNYSLRYVTFFLKEGINHVAIAFIQNNCLIKRIDIKYGFDNDNLHIQTLLLKFVDQLGLWSNLSSQIEHLLSQLQPYTLFQLINTYPAINQYNFRLSNPKFISYVLNNLNSELKTLYFSQFQSQINDQLRLLQQYYQTISDKETQQRNNPPPLSSYPINPSFSLDNDSLSSPHSQIQFQIPINQPTDIPPTSISVSTAHQQKIQTKQEINDFDLKFIVSRHNFILDFVDDFPDQINITSVNSENTLLHFCFNYDSALTLLDNNADIDFKNRLGQTPLLVCPSSEVANLLIQRGASIKIRDMFGRNQLHFCTDLDKLDYFINSGIYSNSKDYDNRTPLFFSNSLDATKLLLDNKCNLRVRDKYLNTPLFYLSNPPVLQFLIDSGLNVNATNYFKQNALFFNNSLSAINVLLQNNINLNQIDSHGRKAFFYNHSLFQIYNSSFTPHSLSHSFNFCKQSILSSEQNFKFNYSFNRSTNSYTLHLFNGQSRLMPPSFNHFYLNNIIPDFYLSQSPDHQQPSPPHSFHQTPLQNLPQSDSSSHASTSDCDFDHHQLQTTHQGGRFLWNQDLLEQAANFMYNNDRNNGLKRTAKKFNVIISDLQQYYNDFLSRLSHSSNSSYSSFHGDIHNSHPYHDDPSIYPSDDDEYIKTFLS